jgi:hypothetical protein
MLEYRHVLHTFIKQTTTDYLIGRKEKSKPPGEFICIVDDDSMVCKISDMNL